MYETVSSLSERQVSSVLVVATVVVVTTWFGTDLAGVSRVFTAGLAGAVAGIAMVLGLRVLE